MVQADVEESRRGFCCCIDVVVSHMWSVEEQVGERELLDFSESCVVRRRLMQATVSRP